MMALFFIVISLDVASLKFFYKPTGYRDRNIRDTVVPWIGVLRVNHSETKRAAVAGIVVIQDHIAIANADDVAKLNKDSIRETTVAIFFNDRYHPWKCDVEDYILHPEYDVQTQNTIAIVFLDPSEKYVWIPINWAKTNYFPKRLFAIGFTDYTKRLEQIEYKMDSVTKINCINYYKKERLNFNQLWPTHYRCFKATKSHKSCVFDAGMALATNLYGVWTLLGISTTGPGCALPSRFIEFVPYAPWIKSTLKTKTRRARTRNGRRDDGDTSDDDDTLQNQDMFILKKIDHSTVLLFPSYPGEAEVVNGDCETIDGLLIYAESGSFVTKSGDLTAQPGTVVYSVSLFDLFATRITCVRVSLNSTKRSKTIIYWDKGFKQDDIGHAIKALPINKLIGVTPPPTDQNPKILYKQTNLDQYDHIRTVTIWFKFEFLGVADVNIQFFGKHVTPIITTTTTETTDSTDETTTRPTRKYSTRLKGKTPPPPVEKPPPPLP